MIHFGLVIIEFGYHVQQGNAKGSYGPKSWPKSIYFMKNFHKIHARNSHPLPHVVPPCTTRSNDQQARNQRAGRGGVAPPQNYLASAQKIVDHGRFMYSLRMYGLCPPERFRLPLVRLWRPLLSTYKTLFMFDYETNKQFEALMGVMEHRKLVL